MYHHIVPPELLPPVPDPQDGWDFTVSPGGLERQLTVLGRRGYTFVSLTEMVAHITRFGSEAPKTVAVTFDDGWLDNYNFAFPVLKQCSISATFFVTTAHLVNEVRDSKRMSAAQLKELASAGMTIGGHSRFHLDLTKIRPERAWEEIKGCKEDLEAILGTAVLFFAYPGGAFNSHVVRLAQEAGYLAACSVLGPARNHSLSRFWLFRDTLTQSISSLGDRYRLSPMLRAIFSFRVRRRLKAKLHHDLRLL